MKLGLQIDFFIAVDGSHPHPLFSHADRRKRIALKGRDFKPGELGCWASHYLLWQACLVSGAPMIIMEDDITISEDFPKLLSLLPELPGKLEYFRLHSAELPGREILRIGEFGFYRYWRSPMCTFGYYVTPQAARKFIEHADEWILPVDDYMDLAWLHGVECIGIKPGLVSCTTGFESTIQPKIRSKARPDFLGLVTRESYRAWLKTRWLLHTLRGRLE